MGHILGSLGAIMLAILMLPQLITWWDTGITVNQQRMVASHMQQVVRAANQYVNQHQGTLLTQATAAGGPSVTIETLVNEGFLPQGFSGQNVWLQEYNIGIRQPQAGRLQAIVLTTGGRENNTAKFQNSIVPGAAAMVGGAGGYIPSGILEGQSADVLLGAGSGWEINLGAVGMDNPGAGHLGAVSSLDGSALNQDFLYRVEVPGQPELNQMQTALDMTEHDINQVASLQFHERTIDPAMSRDQMQATMCAADEDQGRVFLDRNVGLYMCRNHSMEIIADSGNSTLMQGAQMAKSGDHITKPTCAQGTGTEPAIYTSPSVMEAGPTAPPMTAIQTWATSVSDTEWQVFARVQTPNKQLSGIDADLWVFPEDDYHRIMVLTTCAKQTE